MYLNKELFLDFLKERAITWLGIDFSKATFTKKGFDISTEDLQLYINEWNMIVISDQKKYDIRVAFRKPMIDYDLSLLKKINKLSKTHSQIKERVNIENTLSSEKVEEYLHSLIFPQQTRFSLIFIVESFDNSINKGSIWVTILENETKNLVLCEKFMESPSGFNIKSFWARVFYNIFFNIGRTAFLRWENLVKN